MASEVALWLTTAWLPGLSTLYRADSCNNSHWVACSTKEIWRCSWPWFFCQWFLHPTHAHSYTHVHVVASVRVITPLLAMLQSVQMCCILHIVPVHRTALSISMQWTQPERSRVCLPNSIQSWFLLQCQSEPQTRHKLCQTLSQNVVNITKHMMWCVWLIYGQVSARCMWWPISLQAPCLYQ